MGAVKISLVDVAFIGVKKFCLFDDITIGDGFAFSNGEVTWLTGGEKDGVADRELLSDTGMIQKNRLFSMKI